MNSNNYDFFFILGVLANLCQLYDLELNLSQTTNDEIMKNLQEQGKKLDEQTNIYLKEIIRQNNEIIDLLKDKK